MITQILILVSFFLLYYSIMGGNTNFDITVNAFFQTHYTESGKEFFMIMAEIGDKWIVMLLALCFTVYFLIKKNHLKAIVLLSSMLLGVGCSTAIKHIVGRERPANMLIEYSGYSFPSGHSVFAVLFYGLLVYLFWDIIRNVYTKYIILSAAIIMGILVIISRLYLSVHYFSDVLAGSLLGAFWLIFGILIYKRYKKRCKI